jgi:hypothetical protein
MMRFISLFAVAGVLVPVVFQVVFWIVGNYPAIERSIGYGLQKLMLMLWPSSFVMLAASQESLYLGLLLMSIALNVVLYAAIGSAVWYGLNKHYVIIALLAAAIVIMWWKILTL